MTENKKQRNDASGRLDIYQTITDKIIAGIEAGAGEFEMPWHRNGGLGDLPVNALTGNRYSGVNVLALWIASDEKGYGSRYWATYRQWQELDAQVRRKEKGSPVVFYKEVIKEIVEGGTGYELEERTLIARTSWVFNAAQVEGFSEPVSSRRDLTKIVDEAERFVISTKADIHTGGERACYIPSADFIRMPDRDRFTGTSTSSPTESYYAVLLHELAHWTGHKTRLDRNLSNRFGSGAYAMEELVAELGSAFLCANLGITNSPRADHATYIAGWLKVLEEDKRAIVTAAGKARQASQYLSGLRTPP